MAASGYHTLADGEAGREFRAPGSPGRQKMAAETDHAHVVDAKRAGRDGCARYGSAASALDSGGRVLAQDAGSRYPAGGPAILPYGMRSAPRPVLAARPQGRRTRNEPPVSVTRPLPLAAPAAMPVGAVLWWARRAKPDVSRM